MDKIVEGVDHAYAIMDDVVFDGCDILHHDSVLEKVLYGAKSYNVRLNFDEIRVQNSRCCAWVTYLPRG